jgi:tetratricopeptide (TPR) repeat protein
MENIEIVYLLGVCKYHLGLYNEAIKAFTSVLLKDDHYRKNVYLFLAIAYKKINEVDDSLLTLTKAIAYYPKYYDAIILRAKILSKQKRYYDSIEDLNKCIKI